MDIFKAKVASFLAFSHCLPFNKIAFAIAVKTTPDKAFDAFFISVQIPMGMRLDCMVYTNITLRTDYAKICLPTKDRYFIFQLLGLALILSRISENVLLLTRAWIEGTPKYLPRSFVLSILAILEMVLAMSSPTFLEKYN